MSQEDAFLRALAICFGGSLIVTAYLHRPLRRLLPDACGSADRAAFWTASIDVILMLVPLTALLMGRNSASYQSTDSGLILADFLWAPVLGLVVAVFLIAVIVAVLANGEPTWEARIVPREQRDDLRRLLSKVDTIRAHEVVEREAREAESA
jgi:hypothetical protein